MSKVLQLLLHPDELSAALELKFWRKSLYPRTPAKESATLRRCYELLEVTSRSFAAVIKELHPELRDAVMIFYIILRGLDTIEDDTTLTVARKVPILRDFRSVLKTDDWTFTENSEKEKDRVVLVEFDTVLTEYHRLRPEYQDIIADIASKMGNGMADYVEASSQKNYNGVATIKDYDLYCDYVAGIVGEGLTRMAVFSGFGSSMLAENPRLHQSMGLFLQKTNIIRDFREDLDDGRSFWPKEVWSKYADSLVDLADPNNSVKAVHCISDLAILSLNHVPDLLEYLNNINEQSLFSFCAIPQVMSIATLELLFNNPAVFQKEIKIRRGLTAKLILESASMEGVYDIFRSYTRRIHHRNRADDPNFLAVDLCCCKIEQYIDEHDSRSPLNVERERLKLKANGSLDFKIILAGFGFLALTSGVMMLVAYLSGARFDIAFDEVSGFVQRFVEGGALANGAEVAAKSATSVASIVAETAAPLHSDL